MRLTLRIDPSLKGEDRRGNISHSINGDSMVMAVMVKNSLWDGAQISTDLFPHIDVWGFCF